jgi:hypothetical protein
VFVGFSVQLIHLLIIVLLIHKKKKKKKKKKISGFQPPTEPTLCGYIYM